MRASLKAQEGVGRGLLREEDQTHPLSAGHGFDHVPGIGGFQGIDITLGDTSFEVVIRIDSSTPLLIPQGNYERKGWEIT